MRAALLLVVGSLTLLAAGSPASPHAAAVPAPSHAVPPAVPIAVPTPEHAAVPTVPTVPRAAAVPTAMPAAEPSAGPFVLPVAPPAVVLTPFKPPEHRYGSGHRGVDLAAPTGSPVRAAGAGTVVYAGMLAGRGVVSIEHAGGLRTTYEPVLASVAAGQPVRAGEVIGKLAAGHPGCAPADCLHWGARLPGGSYLDPMSLLRPWRVRLKPWDLAGR